MKRKRISQLIHDSGVLGFKFSNETESHTWFVALAEDKMLVKYVFSRNMVVRNYYYDIPYESIDACEDIYKCIVIDFVDCFAVDWQNLTAGLSGVFDSVADKDDEGLLELLAFFGVNYDEFLLDVLYWYGCWIKNVYIGIGVNNEEHRPPTGGRDRRSYSMSNKLEEHLTKKVLAHIPCVSIVYRYDDGIEECWHFALAHNEFWYGHVASDKQLVWPFEFEEYGHMKFTDIDAIGAIRDVLIASANSTEVDSVTIYGQSDASFRVLGLDETDVRKEEDE